MLKGISFLLLFIGKGGCDLTVKESFKQCILFIMWSEFIASFNYGV
jgi:hypothetical protein